MKVLSVFAHLPNYNINDYSRLSGYKSEVTLSLFDMVKPSYKYTIDMYKYHYSELNEAKEDYTDEYGDDEKLSNIPDDYTLPINFYDN